MEKKLTDRQKKIISKCLYYKPLIENDEIIADDYILTEELEHKYNKSIMYGYYFICESRAVNPDDEEELDNDIEKFRNSGYAKMNYSDTPIEILAELFVLFKHFRRNITNGDFYTKYYLDYLNKAKDYFKDLRETGLIKLSVTEP